MRNWPRRGGVLARRWEARLLSPLGATLFVASASALCAAVVTERAWLPLYGSIALLVVGVVWPFVAVWGLRAELKFARSRFREGESIEGVLRIRNRMPWGAVQTGVQQVGEESLAGAPSVRADMAVIEFVPPLRPVEHKLRLPAAARGFYPRHVPQLANGFPFGLVTARRGIHVAERAIVWPRSFSLDLPIRLLRGGADGHDCLVDRSGSQGETIGVRQFRQGDLPKRIHWPQTARQGRTVVREQQCPIAPRVLVSLDIETSKRVVAEHRDAREWAIRVASSVFESWSAVGADVELCLGQESARYSSKTEQNRIQTLDALAAIDQRPPIANHAQWASRQAPPAQFDLHVVIRTSTAPGDSGVPRGDCQSRWSIVVAGPESNVPGDSRRGSSLQEHANHRVRTDVLVADDSLPLVLAGICREQADGKP